MEQRGTGRGVSDAEAAFFEDQLADAEPLDRTTRSRRTAEDGAVPAARPQPPRGRRPAPEPEPSAVPSSPPLAVGDTSGVDGGVAARLRKGDIRPEARLDLHGLTVAEASRAVARFVAQARQADRRCVLVITGKGSAGQGSGAIRREFGRWLNSPANRPHVVCCTEAAPRHGGAGAFYVYLKKKRRG